MEVSWKMWKFSFPFICGCCGKTLYEKREICESCGCTGTLREVNKKDYKLWKLMRK